MEWAQVLNEDQICKKLGISVRSWTYYKKDHPELVEALLDAKQKLVIELKLNMKRKALGYTYTEQKTTIRDEGGKKIKVIEQFEKYAHPDTGAMHLLLKNLDDSWRNNDKATLELKKKELELKEKEFESKNW